MRNKFYAITIIASFLLAACTNVPVPTPPAASTSTPTPLFTPTPLPAPSLTLARPGVYTANRVDILPLPTIGYDLYIVGEAHGEHEVRLFFLDYLKRLHDAGGLRDIVLEEGQGYEPDANAYVQGINQTLRSDLCLRADVLKGVRTLNEQLPDDQKIRVHLVDVDSPFEPIYAHLRALQEQSNTAVKSIEIPAWDKFQKLGQSDTYKLVDQLIQAASDQPAIVNGLETVRLSLYYYFAGNRIGATAPIEGSSSNAQPREEAITRNMQYLLKELKGAPLLALYGAAHTQRQNAMGGPVPDMKAWGQVLAESGVKLHSLSTWGLAGEAFWRGSSMKIDESTADIQFGDGVSLAAVLDKAPNDGIVYIDLRPTANGSVRLGLPYSAEVPASKIYDGLVLFRNVTPMENVCPK